MNTYERGSVMEKAPDHVDLAAARGVVSEHHPRTPLYRLFEEGSSDPARKIYVKYENHAPVRSFKARGALYSLWRLGADQRAHGVVTASTGNHGRGIAFAGNRFGIPVTVVVPHDAPAVKTRPIQQLGADLRVVEGDLLDAVSAAQAIAEEENKRFIEDGEDAGLMAGAATVAWEILDELPDVSAIVVPVGGGNLIAATALVMREAADGVRIIGVQSEAAPSVARSWEAGVVTPAPCATFAGGLATSTPGHLAFDVIRDRVDELLLVSEAELEEQIVRTLERTGEVIEGAAAAAFAGLDRYGQDWSGNIVLVATGGNIEFSELRRLVTDSNGASA